MNSELVSIVIATYNGERYLRQQMSSILEQTHPNFELIVVDDASTDETLSILNEFAALDNRIHVVTAEKNMGLVANFERGLKLAKGNFIALSDQDDIFRKDKIERLLNKLNDHPQCDLVISDLSLIDDAGGVIAQSLWAYQKIKPQSGTPFRRLLYLNFATGCAMMFRRRLLEFALPIPQNCMVHDWWLAVVATSSKGGGICLVRESLTAYRQHDANVLGAMAAMEITLESAISRVKASSRGAVLVEQRVAVWRPHIARLDGYLQRHFWTERERSIIKDLRSTIVRYLEDANQGLLSRLSELPRRLSYVATTKSLTKFLRELFVTIWPSK